MNIFLRRLKLANRIIGIILLTIVWGSMYLIMPTAFAAPLPESELQALGAYPNWVGGSGASCAVAVTTTVSTTQTQAAIIKTIIGIAKTDNIGQAGALVGLMVADDESGFKIYANSKLPVSMSIPHQAVGSDGDSVGVFQQQPQFNWSTVASGPEALSNASAIAQLMDPAYSAEAFFGSPPGSNAPSALSKGLQNISGWQSMTPWAAAQAVQHSATSDGSNYKQYLSDAQSLLNQYWDSSPAVPLPVPITGGQSAGATNNINGVCSGNNTPTSYQNPLRAVQQLRPERIDQGVDYAGQGPVYALGDGIIKNLTNPGWNFGGYDAFITEQLTDGPAKGLYVYMAEACVPVSTLHVGDTVTSNTVICNMINPSGTGIETGWAAAPGLGTAMASDVYREGDSTTFGVNYNQLLVKLGAPSGIMEGGTAVGTLPGNWPQW